MATAPGTRWYNAVWRWHFYAGLFCMPFVLWLATTGTIYLWKPQIEAWLERPYDTLTPSGPRASAEAQVKAALAAVPGATLHKYQLPQAPGEATRVIVGKSGSEMRVYVDPYRLRILRTETESERPMQVISDLHGKFRAGNPGSYLVEIAACWTVTMLLTGLYLWWPRRARAGRCALSAVARRQAAVLARLACGGGDLGRDAGAVPDLDRAPMGKILGQLFQGCARGHRHTRRTTGLADRRPPHNAGRSCRA